MDLLLERMSTLSDKKVAIIDYDMGNLRSVQKAFEKIGVGAIVTQKVGEIAQAEKIVLPGVGAFGDGMMHLQRLGLVDLLYHLVLEQRRHFLGICLGMQLLAKGSQESAGVAGLGWVDADVKKFNFSQNSLGLKVPHVGWNNLCFRKNSLLFQDIPNDSDFYFVHSYHFEAIDSVVTGTTDYGGCFAASIQVNDNIHAVQFHPEKSQVVGLKLLDNFVRL